MYLLCLNLKPNKALPKTLPESKSIFFFIFILLLLLLLSWYYIVVIIITTIIIIIVVLLIIVVVACCCCSACCCCCCSACCCFCCCWWWCFSTNIQIYHLLFLVYPLTFLQSGKQKGSCRNRNRYLYAWFEFCLYYDLFINLSTSTCLMIPDFFTTSCQDRRDDWSVWETGF